MTTRHLSRIVLVIGAFSLAVPNGVARAQDKQSDEDRDKDRDKDKEKRRDEHAQKRRDDEATSRERDAQQQRAEQQRAEQEQAQQDRWRAQQQEQSRQQAEQDQARQRALDAQRRSQWPEEARGRWPEGGPQQWTEQRERAARLQRRLQEQQRSAEQQERYLRQQNRRAYSDYEQDYRNRLREQERRLSSRDWSRYDGDPRFYSAPRYRYFRGGRAFEINEYAAQQLRQAVNFGYAEGFRAGEADRLDGWSGGYRDSRIYEDADYGYDGIYVDEAEYGYYFREGFERGYQDGYDHLYRYGVRRNGSLEIVADVLSRILDLRPLR